jgi:polyhydroxyalkanoate synthesis regulator phasin
MSEQKVDGEPLSENEEWHAAFFALHIHTQKALMEALIAKGALSPEDARDLCFKVADALRNNSDLTDHKLSSSISTVAYHFADTLEQIGTTVAARQR